MESLIFNYSCDKKEISVQCRRKVALDPEWSWERRTTQEITVETVQELTTGSTHQNRLLDVINQNPTFVLDVLFMLFWLILHEWLLFNGNRLDISQEN